MIRGFEPICNDESRVLILGSFPSVVSREENFYYGNKRNRFWKILTEYFCEKDISSVDEKIQFLHRNKIALWDIISACEIDGSLDSNIKNYEYADIVNFLMLHPNIKAIFCNGKFCYNHTLKYFSDKDCLLNIICLPSTSPANACFDKNYGKKIWFDMLDKFTS